MTYEDPRDTKREKTDDPQTSSKDEKKADQTETEKREAPHQYTDWASI